MAPRTLPLLFAYFSGMRRKRKPYNVQPNSSLSRANWNLAPVHGSWTMTDSPRLSAWRQRRSPRPLLDHLYVDLSPACVRTTPDPRIHDSLPGTNTRLHAFSKAATGVLMPPKATRYLRTFFITFPQKGVTGVGNKTVRNSFRSCRSDVRIDQYV